MVNEILKLLSEEMAGDASGMECPTPRQLTTLACGADSGIDIADLAQHIPRCLRCAHRWELIQHDACLSISEALVILHLKQEEFARARAEGHVRGCLKCRGLLDSLNRLGGFASELMRTPLTALSGLPAQTRSTHGSKSPTIAAAVVNSDGTPRIAAEQTVHCDVAVLQAAVQSGFLTIELKAGSGFSSAHVALCSTSNDEQDAFVAVLPSANFANGVAYWRVPVQASDGVIPLDRLVAVLVAQSDDQNQKH